MKEYGFDDCAECSAIIYEKGTEAQNSIGENAEGMIVGTSEWGTITEDNGRRICAALKYFSETSTEEIESLAGKRFIK